MRVKKYRPQHKYKTINKKKVLVFIILPILIIVSVCGGTVIANITPTYVESAAAAETIQVQIEADPAPTESVEEILEENGVEIADVVEETVNASTEEIIEEEIVEIEQTMYTTTSVNIRTGPGKEYPIASTAALNSTIIKVGEEGDWSKIKIDGEYYYIYSSLLSTTKTEKKVSSRGSTSTATSTATTSTSNLTSLGTYKITYYCSCAKCCGKQTGITASGATAIAGVTIAAPSNFAFGTQLVINGHTYTVQDRGGSITNKTIDIYVNSHQEALNLGVDYYEVFQVN